MDRELVERAQRGDESAFAALAVRIADSMYATAHHIIRDTGRAEDAAQQALIDIWRHLPELKDPDRFQACAYRIVVRAAYAEARHRRLWNLRGSSILQSERTRLIKLAAWPIATSSTVGSSDCRSTIGQSWS